MERKKNEKKNKRGEKNKIEEENFKIDRQIFFKNKRN